MKEYKDKLLASEQRMEQLQSLNKVWVDNVNTFNLIRDCCGSLKRSFSLYKMSKITQGSFFILVNQCVVLIQRLESQLGELQTAHEQVQQDVQKLQKEGTEMKQKAKELQRSLETEKAG